MIVAIMPFNLVLQNFSKYTYICLNQIYKEFDTKFFLQKRIRLLNKVSLFDYIYNAFKHAKRICRRNFIKAYFQRY